MALYYCGNPICKGRINSDSVSWPLRCEKCNQQCYPENCQPGGMPDGGTHIRTRDHAFALPTTVLMVEGPRGMLVPFRCSPALQGPSKDPEPRTFAPGRDDLVPSKHAGPLSRTRKKAMQILAVALLVLLGLVTAWIISSR